MKSSVALLTLALGAATPAAAQDHRLVMTTVGRFAIFADLASIRRESGLAEMRALQVADEAFRVGDQAYWGGWSAWRFDCAANTADRLDFTSIKDGGQEGQTMPDLEPAWDAAPGGDAAGLLALACGDNPEAAWDVTTVTEAVAMGRRAIDE